MPVPPLNEYKTPWETKGEEFDPEKGRAFIHWLLTRAEAAETSKKSVETERDELKAKLDEAARQGESDAERQARERKELEDRLAANEKQAAELSALKLDVALDLDGISAKDAKFIAARLSGTSREEIEADAKQFVEKFVKSQQDDGDDDGDDQRGPRQQPRSTARTAGDPKPNSRREPTDAEVLAQVPRIW